MEMEYGGLEDDWLVSKGAIFHFHEYGRKGKFRTVSTLIRCATSHSITLSQIWIPAGILRSKPKLFKGKTAMMEFV